MTKKEGKNEKENCNKIFFELGETDGNGGERVEIMGENF